ncbi:hypothetical protein [Sinomicrobium sp. M5D2P17]
MKWVLNFNYNIDSPLYYEGTTELKDYYSGFNEGDVNTSNNSTRKEILDNLITNDLQHEVGRKTSFGLYVECEINGGSKFKLGDKFAEKYRKMLAPLLWIVNKLDSDLGVSDAKREETRIRRSGGNGILARLNALPMSFELMAPSVGVGIGYGLTENYQAGYELEGRIIADPLIGANVKLDLLALGSKFKPWGAIIDALDIASWLINFCSGGRAEISYELYFQLTSKILLVDANVKDDDANQPANITYNFENGRYNGSIGLKGIIEGKLVASFGFSLQIESTQGKTFQGDIGENAEKKKGELSIGAEGKSYVSVTLGKNFGDKSNFTSDFYFSGFTLKVWAKAGFSGKPKESTFNILPDYESEVNIFENNFEHK